jgi:hypothetical protein
MTARISLTQGKAGAHRAPLQKTKTTFCAKPFRGERSQRKPSKFLGPRCARVVQKVLDRILI